MKRTFYTILVLQLLLSAVLSFQVANQKSVTYDERYYISDAQDLAEGASACGRIDHPPLAKYVFSIVIQAFDGYLEPRLAARLGNLILFLFLVGATSLYSARIFGYQAGTFTAVLTGVSPNLIGHASIATTDLPVTLFIFLSITSFLTFLRRPNFKNVSIWAASSTFALLTKLTALTIIPAMGLILLFRFGAIAPYLTRKKLLRYYPIVAFPLISCFLILLIYKFDLCGFDHIQGLVQLRISQNEYASGVSVYALGTVFDSGIWFYYLVTTLVKEPLPFLFLLILASFYRPRLHVTTLLSFLAYPLILVLAASISVHQLGHRYILPIFPFLILIVSGTCGRLVKKKNSYFKLVPMVALLLYVADSLATYPDYLSYFNQSIGSKLNGYKYLSDSNVDWLQDLDHPRLSKLKKEWALIDLYRDEMDICRREPLAVLIGATELTGVWEEYGFWGDWFTKWVGTQSIRPIDHLGYSRLLFPVRSKGMATMLYQRLLADSWVDAENIRRKYFQTKDNTMFPIIRSKEVAVRKDSCESGVEVFLKNGVSRLRADFSSPSELTPALSPRKWSSTIDLKSAQVLLFEIERGSLPTLTINGLPVEFVSSQMQSGKYFFVARFEQGQYEISLMREGKLEKPNVAQLAIYTISTKEGWCFEKSRKVNSFKVCSEKPD